MAKPTTIPRWADTVTADPTRVNAPPNVKLDVGWDVAEKPPAQWFNWLFLNIYLWIIWLRDFEGTVHNWGATQSFDYGIISTNATVNGRAGQFTGNGTGYGVFARGGANGVGVHGVAFGATTAGVEALGDTTGGAGGPGLLATGGTGGAGGVLVGNGAGPGAVITGGASGAGVIAQGNGSAEGVRGTGGPTNGIGVRAIGTGTGAGLTSVGGASAGPAAVLTGGAGAVGVDCIGGAGASAAAFANNELTKAAATFENTAGGLAVSCNGGIEVIGGDIECDANIGANATMYVGSFAAEVSVSSPAGIFAQGTTVTPSGSNPAKGVSLKNQWRPKQYTKYVMRTVTNAANAITTDEGAGAFTPSIVDLGGGLTTRYRIRYTLTDAMDNVTYSPKAQCLNFDGGTQQAVVMKDTLTTTRFDVAVWDLAAGAWVNLTNTATDIACTVNGQQTT